MESPFSQVGRTLHSLGYSPIPIMPGDKKPGIMVGDDWRLFKGWNEFCTARPSKFQIDLWAKWPNAGVGVACGMGLICIDIDQEACMTALLDILPPSHVQKKGRKGISLFYRGNTDKIRSKNYRTPDRVGLVDLLAEGKQTVLPPSIHPDTNEPYFWWTDATLEDTPLDQLTELPDDIAEQIGEVLKEFGYDPNRERVEAPVMAEDFGTAAVHTSDFFRRLNEDALANIPAWAPKLGLPKGGFRGRVYRAVSPWRGSGSGRSVHQRNPNLSISPGGIEDFGTGETFTALNVVMRALGINEAEIDAAVQWLGEALGYNFGVEIDLRTRPKEPKTVEQITERVTPLPEKLILLSNPTRDGATSQIVSLAPASQLPAAPAAEPAGEPDDELDAEGAPCEPAPPLSELEALCRVPGLVGEIVEWIANSTSSPSRPLALGPALTFVGTLAARHHAGPTDLRTNLYVVALAGAGYGKDHPRRAISRLATQGGLDRFLGPENYLSDSALRKEVERRPALLSVMDEFGAFVGKMMDRRAGTHQSSMRQMLLQLFTTSADVYRGAASAAETATPIFNPCLSMYGTSTPHDFWPSMSGKGVADGFLPRWLVINVPGDAELDVEPTAPRDPPQRLIEWCRAVVTLSRRGNLADAQQGPVKAKVAPFVEGGEDAYRHWRDTFRKRGKAAAPEVSALWTRAMEIALKVAHIVAIGIDPENPVVTGELIDWGARLTLHSTLSCIAEVQDRLASTEKQAEYLKVRRLIKERGTDGISNVMLKRAINGEFDLMRLDNILRQLQESRQIEMRVGPGPRGGRPGARYYAV